MPQMLIITEKYVIFIHLYFFASLMLFFFVEKWNPLKKYFFLLSSASTNLFSLTQIKIRFLIGLK